MMPQPSQVWLVVEPLDMRAGTDSLSLRIQNTLGRSPELNPVYAASLAHYAVVADPCRVADPNRKGTVENAIEHT